MRALMHQPHFLLLEEPWLGLEEQYVQQIKDYLFKYSATTIVVTNDEDFAAKCDIVLELENGSLISTKEK
jgi:predicted ABC-type transport system involved in lysophospholipase L1 biosynthesis ATPase subunit